MFYCTAGWKWLELILIHNSKSLQKDFKCYHCKGKINICLFYCCVGWLYIVAFIKGLTMYQIHTMADMLNNLGVILYNFYHCNVKKLKPL
jgi:prepilin signal peptidase PulO-like enzyme (type II secretory pathway)